jgi:addiction module RelE/StbE family toxin
MRVRYTETALAEVDQIFSYIAEHNRSAAVELRERIERTVEALAEIPEMAQVADEPGVRRMPISSYPYVIFYAVESDELVVLHIRHGARRPLTEIRRG